MCLFSVIYQTIPGCPVLVLANREESPDRPSSLPEIRTSQHANGIWLGGTDLKAGGTWLGINRGGLVVAVTNRRKSEVPAHPKSRGLLCRELLEQGTLGNAETEFLRQWNAERFAGFNLILISRDRGLVVSAADALEIQSIPPGIHAITNGAWNDPSDRRIHRVLELLNDFAAPCPPLEEWVSEATAICGLGEESGGDAICIPCTMGWGTVSSSIIALTDDPQNARYLHSAGSPSNMPYLDYSRQLQNLLKGFA